MKSYFELLLRNRLVVVLALCAIVGFGVYGYTRLPTDAFPDISPVMVPVFAEAHGMAPEEVERLIAYPIESAMSGLPDVSVVKSTSAFGMAVVYVYFEDGVDVYFARRLVADRLAAAAASLPDLEEAPALGPISTGLGEVFMYYLTADSTADTGGKDPLAWLRELNDWSVSVRLLTVPGVTDVLSMGGHVLQYQVNVDPYAMRRHGVRLDEIVEAITANNRNAGGQFLVVGAEEYLVRGVGLIERLEDLAAVQVKVVRGTPVRLRDLAEVEYGNAVRRGVVTLDGESEVVAGIVMKLYGENTSKVIERLEVKIGEVQASLPPGVTLVPYYNQGELVSNAVGTMKDALWKGAVLVVAVLVLLLGHLRGALIVALSLPLCALIAALFMGWSGLSANLMSLGGIAIAIGMLGDASIVVVENVCRHLAEERNIGRKRLDTIAASCAEVARPILFSVAIIIVVFLPLFSLEGVEGKMFSPLAFATSFALGGSIVAALIFAPVLSSLLLRVKPRDCPRCMDWLMRAYRPLLAGALRRKRAVVAATLALFAGAAALVPRLGTEFIPVLEEGAIQVNVSMAPSISLERAAETIMRLEREIRGFAEVDHTVSKIGRPEAGSHPHPVNTAHIQVALRPRSEWRSFRNKAEIVEALDRALSHYPGVQLTFSQPIQNMFDELLSGVRTQLAVKVYGEDLEVLRAKAEEIRAAVDGIPGLVDLSVEQNFGQPQVQVVPDRYACARYGVDVVDVLEAVETGVGGRAVDQVYLGTRRFDIQVRYREPFRAEPEAIGALMVRTREGGSVPLSVVADIRSLVGPILVSRERNERRWAVTANVRGRDLGGVVADMRERIGERVELPPGYHVEYGGQFENQQRAMRRLAIIVPAALAAIFLMLYLSLGGLRSALLIFTNVPLALVGGVLGLFAFGEYLSVPASVGFIALFGIAVQNGLILVTYIDELRRSGLDTARAVTEGALLRLRPVLLTALTTVLGLAPLLFARGMGSEVQRPLAVVVVFGLVSSTFLTLFFIPALYGWFAPRRAGERVTGPLAGTP